MNKKAFVALSVAGAVVTTTIATVATIATKKKPIEVEVIDEGLSRKNRKSNPYKSTSKRAKQKPVSTHRKPVLSRKQKKK